MAKSMARIENGVVINVEWWSDAEPETENLIDSHGRLINIGDVYYNGEFYRGEKKVLTENEMSESLLVENAEELIVSQQ